MIKKNGMKKKFILDTGSSVTILQSDGPNDESNQNTESNKPPNAYWEVSMNEVKIRWKKVAKEDEKKQKMEIIITERKDKTPLLEVACIKIFKLQTGWKEPVNQSVENSKSER